MTRKQTDKLMQIVLISTGLLILLGAIFKLQHYPYGDSIIWIGIWATIFLSSYEIKRLRKIINMLEKQLPKVKDEQV
ncbi:MAG TPA: hypothetical protein VKA27_09590 [Sunxiuqinia sp.]|nr:hypothetical protein [Sunxiuqinia sp.]